MKKYYNISTFIIFGLFSIIVTFYYPYLNQNLGLNLSDVSKVVTLGALFNIIGQPLLTNFYSKVKDKKRFIISYLITVLLAIIGLMFINLDTAIYFALVYGFILNSLAGIFEIYIEELASFSGFEFSDIRKWGSIGYACIVFLGGIIISTFSYRALHLSALALLIILMLIILLKFRNINSDKEISINSNKVEIKDLLKNKNVLFLFLAVALGMGSYMGLDFAYSTYLVDIIQDTNKANSIYSTSISFRVVVEFFSFMIVSKYASKLNSKKCLMTALAIASIKVLLFSTGKVTLIVLGDQLHGVLYGIYLTFLFKYLRDIVESDLVAISFSILSVLSTGGSNFIYPSIYAWLQKSFGYFSMYFAGFVFIIISLLIFFAFLPNPKIKNN